MRFPHRFHHPSAIGIQKYVRMKWNIAPEDGADFTPSPPRSRSPSPAAHHPGRQGWQQMKPPAFSGHGEIESSGHFYCGQTGDTSILV
jgi:hypothetical protein